MAYYAPLPSRGAPTAGFSYGHYPHDTTGYGYSAAPPAPTANPPYPTNSNYYPPSSSKPTRSAYYPPPSPSTTAFPPTATSPTTPSRPRRRSVSFSTPAPSELPSEQKKKEMLYRHINVGTETTPKSSSHSSKPRRFSKTYDDVLDYEYLRGGSGRDSTDHYAAVFDSDSQDDDIYYEYNKEKLSKRFDRSASDRIAAGLKRRGTITEKIPSSSSRSRRGSLAAESVPVGLGLGVKMPSMHSVPRAPRPPAPQRNTPPPPPPPAPASNRSGGSDRSRGGRSDRATHGGTTIKDYDYDYDYNYEYEYVTGSGNGNGTGTGKKHTIREEKKVEKSRMNINGNKIVVDSKGVKINGQRYSAPGGKGVFDVGGIKIRVDGGVIDLC